SSTNKSLRAASPYHSNGARGKAMPRRTALPAPDPTGRRLAQDTDCFRSAARRGTLENTLPRRAVAQKARKSKADTEAFQNCKSRAPRMQRSRQTRMELAIFVFSFRP